VLKKIKDSSVYQYNPDPGRMMKNRFCMRLLLPPANPGFDMMLTFIAVLKGSEHARDPELPEVSVLIGGKAGDGINSAGAMVAQLLNHMGYHTYLYFDYPSLIRGGHNFAIIRGAETPVSCCRKNVDFILALNQETIESHRSATGPDTAIIFNKDVVKGPGQAVPVREILTSEHAPEIMGNSALIGGFARTAGIGWETVEAVFRAHIPKGTDLNLTVARRAYDQLPIVHPVPRREMPAFPLLTGNEAVGLGMVDGGLDMYISYPMTPSSSLLHFLAEQKEKFGIMVVHPENEIAVILMALGAAYAGKRVAVGTSGGGFCLMTEGLSLAGMAELPIVLLVSQRTGPSTGLPTFTGQTDLHFVLHAGQGEYPRLIVAPANAAEALYWSAVAMNAAWKFQIPAIILTDKTLSEGTYSVEPYQSPEVRWQEAGIWDGSLPYRRYADTPSGVSPLAFPGMKEAIVKVDSYAHDEAGITTEDADLVERMTKKRLRKWEGLRAGMNQYNQVQIAGKSDSGTALLCWGATRGACTEVALQLGLRVISPIVLSPFPVDQLNKALAGVEYLIAVEENATGQLATLARQHGIPIHEKILWFNGRPVTPEELLEKVAAVLA
jgi:2-oxoglutarate ferredoxin oxidoreductase subunit alpha